MIHIDLPNSEVLQLQQNSELPDDESLNLLIIPAVGFLSAIVARVLRCTQATSLVTMHNRRIAENIWVFFIPSSFSSHVLQIIMIITRELCTASTLVGVTEEVNVKNL